MALAHRLGAFTVTDLALAALAVVIAAVPPARVAAAWIAVVLDRQPARCTRRCRSYLALVVRRVRRPRGRALRRLAGPAARGRGDSPASAGSCWCSRSGWSGTSSRSRTRWDRTSRTRRSVSGWIEDSSGWAVFTRLDLALTALAALFLAVPVGAATRTVAIARGPAVGWLAIVLVAARMLAPPDPITDARGGRVASRSRAPSSRGPVPCSPPGAPNPMWIRALAVLGGAALLGSLFLPWYELDVATGCGHLRGRRRRALTRWSLFTVDRYRCWPRSRWPRR